MIDMRSEQQLQAQLMKPSGLLARKRGSGSVHGLGQTKKCNCMPGHGRYSQEYETSAPTDGVRHAERSTVCYIGDQSLGNGTLFITEGTLMWINDDSRQGFSLEYPKIAVHAISRDISSFAHECLYMILDGNFSLASAARTTEHNQDVAMNEDEESSDNEDEENEDLPTTEMRFVPVNKDALGAMYTAMCDCQALHSDPDDSSSGDEGLPPGGSLFGFARESDENGENGASMDADGDAQESGEDGQFDDADTDEGR